MEILSTILVVIGFLFLAKILLVLVLFGFKVVFAGTVVSLSFLYQNIGLLFKKWWAIAIQLPFLVLEILLITFQKTEGFIWALLIQILVSTLMVNVFKITEKRIKL
ncbi:hypothetical protein PG593_10370 [Riemerella anatipestifer]|nr:hypothetical protein [Riemerella anatipestifer]